MRIELGSAIEDASYIRYARSETLKACSATPTDANIAPLSFATYLFAYDDQTMQRIGMAESAMLSEVYGTYDNNPNAAICNLNQYCPIEQMASIRTVFAEPEYRGATASFLGLTLASAKLFHSRGARFATATTSNEATHLHKLYRKYGGDCAGQKLIDGVNTVLFVFDLDQLLRHRAMRRVATSFAFEQQMDPLMVTS